MLYSIACEYAIRGMTLLAEKGAPGRHMLLRDILANERLPQHFVGKIFQTLVRAGLLSSVKGRGGGFALRRPAGQITLYDIVQAVDGTERFDRCLIGRSTCDDWQSCPLHAQWKPIREAIDRMLHDTTLADMARKSNDKRPREHASAH